MGWQDKRCCASSHCEHVRLYTEHMPMVTQYLDTVLLFICKCLDLIITCIILSMQRPFIHPYAYSILILLFTSISAAVFISFLLLFHYCYCYKTVTTDKLLRTSPFSGAGELTTHMLRLTNILWHPLCRINKFGLYFPRRLLRSPILVGHHPLARICDG